VARRAGAAAAKGRMQRRAGELTRARRRSWPTEPEQRQLEGRIRRRAGESRRARRRSWPTEPERRSRACGPRHRGAEWSGHRERHGLFPRQPMQTPHIERPGPAVTGFSLASRCKRPISSARVRPSRAFPSPADANAPYRAPGSGRHGLFPRQPMQTPHIERLGPAVTGFSLASRCKRPISSARVRPSRAFPSPADANAPFRAPGSGPTSPTRPEGRGKVRPVDGERP
jgi:hypothetical protein